MQLPEPVEKHVKTYVTSKKWNSDYDLKYAITLWHPFNSNIGRNNQMQEKHCILGDVGRFNSKGGFDVMFNIFMTMEENRKMNYFPPITFTPFQASTRTGVHLHQVPARECQYFITDDLENCDIEQRMLVFGDILPQIGITDFYLPRSDTGVIASNLANILKTLEQQYL